MRPRRCPSCGQRHGKHGKCGKYDRVFVGWCHECEGIHDLAADCPDRSIGGWIVAWLVAAVLVAAGILLWRWL